MSPGQRCGQTSSGDAALVKPGELDRAFSRCTVLRSVVSCAAGQGMPHPWFLLEQEQGDIGLSWLLCTRQERSLHSAWERYQTISRRASPVPRGCQGSRSDWTLPRRGASSHPRYLHPESSASSALQRCPHTPPPALAPFPGWCRGGC